MGHQKVLLPLSSTTGTWVITACLGGSLEEVLHVHRNPRCLHGGKFPVSNRETTNRGHSLLVLCSPFSAGISGPVTLFPLFLPLPVSPQP